MHRAGLVLSLLLSVLVAPVQPARVGAIARRLFCPIALALTLVGCAHPVDGVVASLNESQRVLVTTHDALAAEHRRERDEAVAAAANPEDAKQRTAKVHAAYAPRWALYTRVRLAWIAAAALANGALLIDKSGKVPDLTATQAAIVKVTSALADLAAAMKEAP